ncbi:hypothetical protein BKA59DRAFT_466643 [Fusarium tricinctum]|uniref:Uncharacterized protein n=1 Tax=Fusarium tricinctum TaxID=61284 RepID=A0A8K0WIA6_9HYPO|nr:hypothetical protein BKA59DRAFT_466643 [Fusarium tricinctum]
MLAINSAAVNHSTRDFLLYSAIVGLPLNFIRFILMVRPTGFFTLILLTCSAIFGLTVRRLHRQGAHLKSTFATPITEPLNCLIADILLGILSLVTLIFTWTCNRWQDTGETFLVAYSSTPLMFNMFLHLYLAILVLLRTHKMKGILRELIGDLVPSTPHRCPHCHGQPEYHDDHDEEQPLVTPSVGDEENTHGNEVVGPSGVWGQ